jgi:hypothetical protein
VKTPELETGRIVRYVVEGPILALVETHEGMGVVLGIGGAEATVISGRALELIECGPDPRDAEVEQLRQRITELERDRARRPVWSDGRDLAIKFRNEGATDGEITEGFLGLWGGTS